MAWVSMTRKRLQSLIEEICNDFGVKCKFTREEMFAPMFVEENTREIIVNLSMLEEILLKGEIEIPIDDLEKIIINTIKHESEHIRVLEELEKRGIPPSKSCRGEYVIAIEAYIENNVPTLGAVREFIRDITLGPALINPARAYLEAHENAFDALIYVLFLSENEIKATFKMDYPFFSDLLLDLKKIASETRTIEDIPKSAEKIRKLKGVKIIHRKRR